MPRGDLTIPLDLGGCLTGEHAVTCRLCGVEIERVPAGENDWAWRDADGRTHVRHEKPPLHPQIAAEMLSLAMPQEAVDFEDWDGSPDTPLHVDYADGTPRKRRKKPALTRQDVQNYVDTHYGWGLNWDGGGHSHFWLGCPTGAHPRAARSTPDCHGSPMHLQPRGWVCRVRENFEHDRRSDARDWWLRFLDYYALPRDLTVVHDVVAQRGPRSRRRAA